MQQKTTDGDSPVNGCEKVEANRPPMQAPVQAMGLLEALKKMQAGELATGVLAADSRRNAEASQSRLHAFACLNPAAPDPAAVGPLAGIPIGIKDLMATADMVTSSGSPLHADHVPAADAWVVARLRSLGAYVTGKTVTTEFAWRHPGLTCNPWNLAHTPGGSSSGSAAAVAAGLVSGALGTQTLGSIIRPAAFCGVVGVKPSFGAISRIGIQPLAGSLDHVGVFARSVSDAAWLLSWALGSASGEPQPAAVPPFAFAPEHGVLPWPRPHLALMHTRMIDRASPAQRELLHAKADALQSAGARVRPMELPPEFDQVWTDIMVLIEAEAAVIHGAACDRDPSMLSAHIHGLVERGRALRAETYLQARDRQQRLRAVFTRLLTAADGPDAILTLPAAGAAPAGLTDTGDASFCAPWSFLGVPAIALPATLDAAGLPLGLQLVGGYRADLKLLRIARWCEPVLGFDAICPRRY